ncbi:5950_t:CDS:2 [Paraglomus brasilianum]|uniref:5950_t:CDS:1 n=1 Tax=Paraglomus brasilianum TaxID=144538 RepID=A0A9N8Z1Q3_9GLOM|nr:5950_t:CDS:2 [Paraglomus brasilianum]
MLRKYGKDSSVFGSEKLQGRTRKDVRIKRKVVGKNTGASNIVVLTYKINVAHSSPSRTDTFSTLSSSLSSSIPIPLLSESSQAELEEEFPSDSNYADELH